MKATVETSPEQFAALAAGPADAPVVMVNLLKFKQPGGFERDPQDGLQVTPHLERVGQPFVTAAPGDRDSARPLAFD